MPTPPATPAPPRSPTATIEAYRAAGERGDADAIGALLAPDVSLHSPLTERVRFEGRDEVTAMHRDIFAVLGGLRTEEPFVRGDERAFVFSADVRGHALHAVVLAAFDGDARIVDLTLFGRPLPSTAALYGALPPRVATRRRGRAVGTMVAALARPLGRLVDAVDRQAPRFL